MLHRSQWLLVCMTGTLSFAPAFAQEAGSTTQGVGALEEVIVTARRVEENIQRVPVAVTAFTPETVEQLDLRDHTSIGKFTPGVQACCGPFNAQNYINIRGILNGAPTYFADAPVSAAGFSNAFDLASLQVLKGPQGTLFGQASDAGAFIYVPNKPSSIAGGYIALAFGDFERRTVEGAVNVPMAGGRFNMRLAGISHYRGGFIHDLSNNQKYGAEDYYTLRPSFVWNITDSLENYTLLQYSHAQDNGNGSLTDAYMLSDMNFNPSQPSQFARIATLNGGNTAAYLALAEQMLATRLRLGPYVSLGTRAGCASELGPVFATSPVTSLTAGPSCPGNWFEDKRGINTTTWRFSDVWTVKNIFSYGTNRTFRQPFEATTTPMILQLIGDPRQTTAVDGPRSWSEELQFQGSIGRFDLTVGTFHTARKTAPGKVYGGLNLSQSLTDTVTKARSHAIYGQTTFPLTERLTATLGLRYNIDKIEQSSLTYNAATGALLGQAVSADSPLGNAKFTNTSYTAGLQYQHTPETMFFITNSQGFSAGGFRPAGLGYYSPEVLNNVEAGVKTTFDLGTSRVRVNTSVYYGWFDNAQVSSWTSYLAPISNVPSVGNLITNAAKATISGIEAELTFVPATGVEIGGFIAYGKNDYTDWMGINQYTGQPFDFSETEFIFIPKYKYNLRAAYQLPLPESIGRISLNADYTHRTKYYVNPFPPTPLNPANPVTGMVCSRERTAANGYPASVADGGTAWTMCVGPNEFLDVSAKWQSFLGHENVTLSFNMSNVTGETISDAPNMQDFTLGFTATPPADPRMYFVKLRYDF